MAQWTEAEQKSYCFSIFAFQMKSIVENIQILNNEIKLQELI